MENKRITDNGETRWLSRSVSVEVFIIACDEYNEPYLLCNKRGGKCIHPNTWNVPSGYLDYNETLEQCAMREVFEETNANVVVAHYDLAEIISSPEIHNQNIVFKYIVNTECFINEFELNNGNSEDDEVQDIKWIPFSDIDQYEWAFHQREFIGKYLIE